MRRNLWQVSSSSVPEPLLTKPDPVYHGESDERKSEAAPLQEFKLEVRPHAWRQSRGSADGRAAAV